MTGTDMNRAITNGCFSALFVVTSLFFFSNVHAQGMHVTASNMALGGGGGAYMNGYHANFINPANLMIPDGNKRVTVGILGGLSSGVGGGLVNISLYNEHFTTGKQIDTPTAIGISNDWFGSGSDDMQYLGFDLGVVPIGGSYRRDDMAFSAAFRMRAMSTLGISKGMFQLGLTGLNTEVFGERKNVNLNNEMLAFGELSFGYAMEVWRNQNGYRPGTQRVYAGVAPKILFGLSYAKIGFDSRLQVTGGEDARVIHEFDYYIESVGELTKDLEQYYHERRVLDNSDAVLSDYVGGDSFSDAGSVQGTGFAIDLGGTWEWYMKDIDLPVIGSGPQILRASLSFTDVGGINFSNNAGDFRAVETFDWSGAEIDFEYIDEEHDGELSSYFDYILEDSIGSDIYGNFSPRDVSSHRVGLTSMVNIGGALTMGRLDVMLDIGKGFNNRGVNSRRMYTALGTEYRIINVIPMRFGMRLGGHSAMNLSFGTGVNFNAFEFSVGMMTTPSSQRGGANIAAAWSGFVMRF